VPGLLYPPDAPRSRGGAAEALLHEALRRQLPRGWRAWHAFRVCVPGQGEAEGDFVIAAPGAGLLIVEVKGGAIRLDGGRWYQNGKLLDPPPRQQAQRYARLLATALAARGAAVPPWEIVCAFPDTPFTAPPGGADVAGFVLGARDLDSLATRLPDFLARALGGRASPAGERWLDALHELWGETWVPSLSLPDRVDEAERHAIRLNDEQLAMLDFAGQNPRALVDGGAGTGKSIVARELAVRWARQGRRALYLCFTDALARSVARNLEAERWRGLPVRATSIRLYARELLASAGHALPPPSKQFWENVSLEAAFDALPPPGDRPALVVVDEAQDLEPNDWLLVEALVGDRAVWAFADERQRFWRERKLSDALFAASAPRLRLKQQHRNPEAIRAFAARYAANSGDSSPVAAADPSVLRISVARGADVLDRVRHELDELRRVGARPQDIAVLTLTGRDKSLLVGLGALGSHRLVLADDDRAPASIVADTFLRFKGLERPFIVVTELVHGATMQYETRMHITLTRATVGAIVVCYEHDLAQDERLRM
jgi:hypothetical protein